MHFRMTRIKGQIVPLFPRTSFLAVDAFAEQEIVHDFSGLERSKSYRKVMKHQSVEEGQS
jgi:hypothetical protein